MITLENGWVQWDSVIGSYRGIINDVIYGLSTGHLLTPEAFEIEASISLSSEDKINLRNERDSIVDIQNNNPLRMKTIDFINRFTQDEMQSIFLARQNSPQIELLLFKLQNIQEIDLRSKNMIDAVTALKNANLITEERRQTKVKQSKS